MKIIFTRHAEGKLAALKKEGWVFTKLRIKKIIQKPDWQGSTRFGQRTVIGLINGKHILRIVLGQQGKETKVITLHLGRRGRYESTL